MDNFSTFFFFFDVVQFGWVLLAVAFLDHFILVYTDTCFYFLLAYRNVNDQYTANRLAPQWFSRQAVFPPKSEMHFYCCCFCSHSNLKRLSCKKGPETKTCWLLLRLLWIDTIALSKGRMFSNAVSSTLSEKNPEVGLSLWVVDVEKHTDCVRSVLIPHSVKSRVKPVWTRFVVALLHKSYWHHILLCLTPLRLKIWNVIIPTSGWWRIAG